MTPVDRDSCDGAEVNGLGWIQFSPLVLEVPLLSPVPRSSVVSCREATRGICGRLGGKGKIGEVE